jgi:hypothetical protein
MYYDQPEEAPEYEEGRDYNQRELSLMADAMLRDDARSELCKECKERGTETGYIEHKAQSATDAEGHTLSIEFPEFECPNGHKWYKGEGMARGIGGENPILFEEHLQSRKRREIYTTLGTPEPEIVSGIYNRVHPQGRKVNSDDQRKKKWSQLLPIVSFSAL